MYEYIICFALGVFIYFKQVLDFKGTLAAAALGISLCFFGGFDWVFLMLIFLSLGYASTKYKFSYKESIKVAESDLGRRNAVNVLGNGLVPLAFGFLFFIADVFFPNVFPREAIIAGFVASVATITADTLSSEIGVLSKGEPLLITSLKKVPMGTDGGVSPLGSLAGISGAVIIGISSWLIGILGFEYAMFSALLGGIIGFNFDSLLGATLEREGIIGNASVNFLSSLTGGFLVFLMVLMV